MQINSALYARRRLANVTFRVLSCGAAIFGMVWLSFILYALLKNPDVLARACEEVDRVLGPIG